MHCEDVHYYSRLLKYIYTLSLSVVFRSLSFIVFFKSTRFQASCTFMLHAFNKTMGFSVVIQPYLYWWKRRIPIIYYNKDPKYPKNVDNRKYSIMMTPRYPEYYCEPDKYGAWSIRVNNFWRLKTINKQVYLWNSTFFKHSKFLPQVFGWDTVF